VAPVALKMPFIVPDVPAPLRTWTFSFVLKSAMRSRKTSSSKLIGDCSSSCRAMSCWPAIVRTGKVRALSVRSVSCTGSLSFGWTAVAVPVAMRGIEMLSVPAGRGWVLNRFAVGRPARASSIA
jgi:hypothetical protein